MHHFNHIFNNVDFEEVSVSLYQIYRDSSKIHEDIAAMTHKCQIARELIECPKNNQLTTYTDDMLMQIQGLRKCLEEEIKLQVKAETALENNLPEVLNIEDQSSTMKQQLDQLQLDFESMQTDYEQKLEKITKEKNDGDKRIEAMNNDLEQQIDDCIEINDRLEHANNSEIEFKKNLLGMLEGMSQSSNIGHILRTIHQSLGSWRDENIQSSKSSFQIDNMQNENSLCNVTIIDCDDMLGKINELDWENCERINELVENSISLFLQSVTSTFGVTENTEANVQLKNISSAFGSALLNKLENIRGSRVDLITANDIKNVGDELQESVNENKDKILESSNNSLIDIEEIMLAKIKVEKEVASLKLNVSSLHAQLEEHKMSISRAKELEDVNKTLESSLRKLKEEHEMTTLELDNMNITLKNSISELTEEYEMSILSAKELEDVNKTLESSLRKLKEEHEMTTLELDNMNITLKNSISKLTKEYEMSISSAKELEDVNKTLESSLRKLKEELEMTALSSKEFEDINSTLKNSLRKLGEEIKSLNDFENIDVHSDLSNGELNQIRLGIINMKQQFDSNANECIALHDEKCITERKMEELQKRIGDLLIENERLNDTTFLKTREDEFVMLQISLEEERVKQDELQSRFMSVQARLNEANKNISHKEEKMAENEDVMKTMKEQISTLQTALESHILELENAVEDCINCNEELATCKLSLDQKEEQFVQIREVLRSLEGEMEAVLKENKEAKNAIETLSLELTVEKENAETIIQGNIAKLEDMEISKDEMKAKLDALTTELMDNETRLTTSVSERDLLTSRVDELEEMRLNMCETINMITLQLEDLKREKQTSEGEAAELRVEVESIKERMQGASEGAHSDKLALLQELCDRGVALAELSAKMNDLVEKNNAMTIEISLKENIVSELSTKLGLNEAVLLEVREELALLTRKAEDMVKQGSVSEEVKSRISSLEIELGLRNKEIAACKKDLESARENLAKKSKQEVADADKLLWYQNELKQKDLELRSSQAVTKKKELASEEHLKKAQQSLFLVAKEKIKYDRLRSEFDSYKNDQTEVDEEAIAEAAQDKETIAWLQANMASVTLAMEQSKISSEETVAGLQAEVALMRKELEKVKISCEETEGSYTELKARYLGKRQRTEELTKKYESLVRFCKEKGVVVPRDMARVL